MEKTDSRYRQYVALLHEELIPATGCTEPVAIAYAAAAARRLLDCAPDSVLIQVSGNILKNAKSVTVPGTGGLHGIPAAAATGIVAGDPDKRLDVINHVSPEQTAAISSFLDKTPIRVEGLDTPHIFDILVRLCAGGNTARVRITGTHTNITLLEHNGQVLEQRDAREVCGTACPDGELSLEEIYDFCRTADLADVMAPLERQAALNWAIAEEGLRTSYGAAIGPLLRAQGDDPKNTARAYAAAASDARMGGCDMPVVINSGSGNQGICACIPILVYARAHRVPQERMYRALLFSNLAAVYQKRMIGYLSAYCGAVSAGAASGAGIAYLLEESYDAAIHTLVNALAMASGIICDGAKPSCAAKIALSVEAGLLGYQMYKQGTQFRGGEGILSAGGEETLRNVARLARDGMSETDREIIQIMLES